ncbi:transglycosylase SLT domain-containing protein [Roseomonas sp. NAR14]|uniref:Transglycosylase SLT domain-containing protein n=1 Tax=Roseomonas acroporae TaxID=2937791 RepID=A0A9X1Y5U9_9PROT|nr:transglycosylase SLT domain-containing protein [Roseomonas acroporae]MCK8784789.1 transglycosylase SLT domain-containing protein [Roseomonas acroporae]
MPRLPPLLALPFLALPFLAGGTARAQPAAGEDWTLCRRAIAALEPGSGIPPGLLGAIALVESGRAIPGAGRAEPWPWAYNAAGDGNVPPGKARAVAEVAALLGRGVRSVDVGCMQINLQSHPAAFATLEEAFDPLANVRYAIRFLNTLRSRTGDWGLAIARYHSGEVVRGAAYYRRVAMAQLGNAWDRGGAVPLPPAVAPSCAAGYVATLLVGGPEEARRFLTPEAQRRPPSMLFVSPRRPRFACLRGEPPRPEAPRPGTATPGASPAVAAPVGAAPVGAAPVGVAPVGAARPEASRPE